MQIANVALYDTFGGTTSYTLKPDFARKDGAAWFEDTLPEVGRRRLDYTRRDPVKGQSPFVMHRFRLTIPVLRSMVTDPAGPYAPIPALDFAPPAELTVWTHERDTEAQRNMRLAGFMLAPLTSSFHTLVEDVVVKGRTLY